MVSHTWAIGHVSEIEIAAGCDLDPARVERFRENWGNKWPDARLYGDYREMLESEDLDIVTVATPEHLHAEPTVAAAESGVRAIFCEKPLATSVEDADRMIAACEANGVILSVDYTRRLESGIPQDPGRHPVGGHRRVEHDVGLIRGGTGVDV